MLDLGWQELFFIALLALIVVGPKDLPIMVRSISRWIFKARRLVQDFQGSMESAARELEIDNIKHEVNKVYDDTEDGFLTQNDKMTESNHQEVESSNKKDPQEGSV
jgi:sec-independent protein translocase protein TatB|tara:strand:- start:6488 stop:6805 length:318 start_codon:yes stop_codon:yes gene_type:complete